MHAHGYTCVCHKRTTVSVRMISGVSMFGRVHRILAANCTADAESADNVRDVDFQIQRQGWIGMRHVWKYVAIKSKALMIACIDPGSLGTIFADKSGQCCTW